MTKKILVPGKKPTLVVTQEYVEPDWPWWVKVKVFLFVTAVVVVIALAALFVKYAILYANSQR